MHGSRWLVAVLSLMLLAGCGGGSSGGMTDPGLPPPTNSASGTVTFKGAPLPGVQVSIFCTNDNTTFATTTTDAQASSVQSAVQAATSSSTTTLLDLLA